MAQTFRGDTHRFEAAFFEDANRTVGLVPATDQYPTYEIYGPYNELFKSGVASRDDRAGYWYVSWTVPPTAPLTTDNYQGRIDWVFVTSRSQQVTYSEEFEIKARSATVTEEGAKFYLGLPGRDQRILYRTQTRPDDIWLEISNNANPDTPVLTVPMSDLTEYIDGDSYVYVYDIPSASIPEGTYQIIWTVRETPTSFDETYYQQLTVITRCWLPYINSLRLFMDKVQKKLNTPRGITDTDLFEFLQRGLEIVNGWHPNNIVYTCKSYPHQQMGHFLVTAAALYGYEVMYSVESDLHFDWTGQTTTLSYDHTGQLDTSISRMASWLQDNLTNTKMGIMRRSTATGVVGVRPYRYNGRDAVFLVNRRGGGSSTPSDYLSMLSYFGLDL